MKKIIALLMILAIAISPLFRGLFFNMETSGFLALLALLAFIYFMIKLSKKETVFYNKWILIFGVLLVIAYSLAFLTAVNPRQNFSALLTITEYLVFSIVIYDYYHLRKESLALALMLPKIISGFVNSVIGLEAITGAFKILNNTLNNKRLGGTFQYANTASIYFAIIIIFSLTVMYALDKPILRILLTSMNNTILLAMLLTRSRGGYIVGFAAILLLLIIQAKGYRLKTTGSFFCAIVPALIIMQDVSNLTASQDALALTKYLLISFFSSLVLALIYEAILNLISKIKNKIKLPKIINKITPILVAVVLIIGFVFLWDKIIGLIPPNIIERFARISLSEINVFLRLTFDKDALKLISKNWLLGVGGGGWAVLYYSVQEFLYISRAVHNHFLEIFVEAGIFGFIAFTAIVFLSFYHMIAGIIKAKDKKQRIYLAGLLAGFTALVIHCTFDFDLSYISLGLLFWLMVVSSVPKEKHQIKFNNSIAKLFLIICSSILILINSIFGLAAYNAHKGLKSLTDQNYSSARQYYEEALRLDQYNSDYTYELNKIYNTFASQSTKKENIDTWRKAALTMAERSIALNPFQPENNRALIRSYHDLNMPLNALEYAKKLITYQKYNLVNYNLLARSYVEAAKFYLGNKDPDMAYILLENCLEIEPPSQAKGINNLALYKNEAIALRKKIEK